MFYYYLRTGTYSVKVFHLYRWSTTSKTGGQPDKTHTLFLSTMRCLNEYRIRNKRRRVQKDPSLVEPEIDDFSSDREIEINSAEEENRINISCDVMQAHLLEYFKKKERNGL